MYLLCCHNSFTNIFEDVILYATLRGGNSVGDTLINVVKFSGIVLMSGVHIQSVNK